MASDLVSVRAHVSVTKLYGTLGEPDVTADALYGEYLARWARDGRLNIVWEQLETTDDRPALNAIVDLPQYVCNRARHQLTSACNVMYQVPPTYACDRFSVTTSAEAL